MFNIGLEGLGTRSNML